uniref:NADH-ubiquinone oxidoreductase chain 4 n=1 Tax=Meghimatium bilineatum TaxID=318265 RepID=A0A344AZ08_9EUPU|nr:NADH dehydrogenase subunit 4 [Meghimatium bilineatum]UZH97789.1 NADH dehydrogenase subunit 4 [Meghimatium bilineatum]
MALYFTLFLTMLQKTPMMLPYLSLLLLSNVSMLNHNFTHSENEFTFSTHMSGLMVVMTIFLVLGTLICCKTTLSTSLSKLIIMLSIFVIFCFQVNDCFLFYILFELTLLPIMYAILMWGTQPERLQAGIYMLLYTVTASLPLLALILLNQSHYSTSHLYLLQLENIISTNSYYMLFILIAFLVKLPMYGFHMWLPKAHVEAPVAGSMILAGILLKLGGYGLFLMTNIIIFKSTVMLFILINLSLWGGLIASFICVMQSDMKSYVAYSSVVHMSVVICSLLVGGTWGLITAKMALVAHGFVSPLMFYLVHLTYSMSGSRSLYMNKGLLMLSPILSMFWFLTLSISMAAPPSLNLLGELSFIPCLHMMNWAILIVFLLMLFLGVFYHMYLYSALNHGPSNFLLMMKKGMKAEQYTGFLFHLSPYALLFNSSLIMTP